MDSDDVVAVIAGVAVSEVQGVADMAGGFAGGISEVFRQGKNTATSLGMGNNSKDVDYIGNAYK